MITAKGSEKGSDWADADYRILRPFDEWHGLAMIRIRSLRFLANAAVLLLQMVTKNTRNADNDFPRYRVVEVRSLLPSTNQTAMAVRLE